MVVSTPSPRTDLIFHPGRCQAKKKCDPNYLAPLAPLRGEGPGERGAQTRNFVRRLAWFPVRPGPLIPSPSLCAKPGEKGARVSVAEADNPSPEKSPPNAKKKAREQLLLAGLLRDSRRAAVLTVWLHDD